jgi:hypothetical protein
MSGVCSTNGEKRSSYRLLLGKPEGTKALGRPRLRRLDNSKMDEEYRLMGCYAVWLL